MDFDKKLRKRYLLDSFMKKAAPVAAAALFVIGASEWEGEGCRAPQKEIPSSFVGERHLEQ